MPWIAGIDLREGIHTKVGHRFTAPTYRRYGTRRAAFEDTRSSGTEGDSMRTPWRSIGSILSVKLHLHRNYHTVNIRAPQVLVSSHEEVVTLLYTYKLLHPFPTDVRNCHPFERLETIHGEMGSDYFVRVDSRHSNHVGQDLPFQASKSALINVPVIRLRYRV